jgi:hypothetical protein
VRDPPKHVPEKSDEKILKYFSNKKEEKKENL